MSNTNLVNTTTTAINVLSIIYDDKNTSAFNNELLHANRLYKELKEIDDYQQHLDPFKSLIDRLTDISIELDKKHPSDKDSSTSVKSLTAEENQILLNGLNEFFQLNDDYEEVEKHLFDLYHYAVDNQELADFPSHSFERSYLFDIVRNTNQFFKQIFPLRTSIIDILKNNNLKDSETLLSPISQQDSTMNSEQATNSTKTDIAVSILDYMNNADAWAWDKLLNRMKSELKLSFKADGELKADGKEVQFFHYLDRMIVELEKYQKSDTSNATLNIPDPISHNILLTMRTWGNSTEWVKLISSLKDDYMLANMDNELSENTLCGLITLDAVANIMEESEKATRIKIESDGKERVNQ